MTNCIHNCLNARTAGFLRLLLLGVSAITMLAACQAGTNAVDSRRADAKRIEVFSENLVQLHPVDQKKAAVVETLRAYRDSYERFDLASIADMMTKDFVLQYSFVDAAGNLVVLTQPREQYLNIRRDWQASDTPGREYRMAVKNLKRWPDEEKTSVVVATTYESRHFNPRFLEIFIFEEQGGQAKLAKILMSAIYPEKPEDYDVDVYFTELKSDYYDLKHTDIRREMIAVGPDAAFEKYVERFSKTAPFKAREQKIPLIVLFREPPPKGSTIEVFETQIGRGRNKYYSFQTVTSEGDPYYFLANQGWWGSGYSIEVKVVLDGVTIHRETLLLPR